ncbi:hypothetical protein BT96DRAFT_971631 [Gymnopus androsaceus JB14]|uniref:N-acetyltransferase domain-containing protein n=1 Tax=Gymnopus androsaceus JB14 TaxID=1447944 RepID=A0A6A4I8I7_9AGAR|nr:hypothetical protein BT96DRAFT_971631 [Gymnopus androsaceus JB14]
MTSPGSSSSPAFLSYKLVKGPDVTQETLQACADLFAQNYGIWNQDVVAPLKPGSNICWITQLVVSSEWRKCGIATFLIKMLPGRDFKCGAIGLVSSHPAACLALAKKAGIYIGHINLDYIAQNAEKILSSSPVNYLQSADLRGRIFGSYAEGDTDSDGGVVSAVFTNFFVDHQEPLEVLQKWEEICHIKWPLGVLLDGYEFLCVFPIPE